MALVQFFREYEQFKAPTWLMVEAYDDVPSSKWCAPVDPKGSGETHIISLIVVMVIDGFVFPSFIVARVLVYIQYGSLLPMMEYSKRKSISTVSKSMSIAHPCQRRLTYQ